MARAFLVLPQQLHVPSGLVVSEGVCFVFSDSVDVVMDLVDSAASDIASWGTGWSVEQDSAAVVLMLSRRMGKSGNSLASATGPRLTLLDLTLRKGRASPFCFDGLYDGKLKLRTGGRRDEAEALRRGGGVAGAKTSSLCKSM